MSTQIFPALPGLSWDVKRTPIWSTATKQSASGREYRVGLFSLPRYKYSLKYEVLRANAAYAEWQTLLGFYNARSGAFDTFYFNDPSDNSVTAQQFGTGDGVTTGFQLVRALGGFVEPVYATNSTPAISVGGTLKTAGTDYTINATGFVTFTSAPGAAAAITWTGSFYWICRFDSDTTEFNQFYGNYWENKKVELMTCKP